MHLLEIPGEHLRAHRYCPKCSSPVCPDTAATRAYPLVCRKQHYTWKEQESTAENKASDLSSSGYVSFLINCQCPPSSSIKQE